MKSFLQYISEGTGTRQPLMPPKPVPPTPEQTQAEVDELEGNTGKPLPLSGTGIKNFINADRIRRAKEAPVKSLLWARDAIQNAVDDAALQADLKRDHEEDQKNAQSVPAVA